MPMVKIAWNVRMIALFIGKVDSGEKHFTFAPKEKQNQHIAAGQPVAREREIGSTPSMNAVIFIPGGRNSPRRHIAAKPQPNRPRPRRRARPRSAVWDQMARVWRVRFVQPASPGRRSFSLIPAIEQCIGFYSFPLPGHEARLR